MANLQLVVAALLLLSLSSDSASASAASSSTKGQGQSLRFSEKGEFRILQVADMHYGDGKTTLCEDVLPQHFVGCSDLNTTAFLHRMIAAVNPHLIVFTGTFTLLTFSWFNVNVSFLLLSYFVKPCFSYFILRSMRITSNWKQFHNVPSPNNSPIKEINNPNRIQGQGEVKAKNKTSCRGKIRTCGSWPPAGQLSLPKLVQTLYLPFVNAVLLVQLPRIDDQK